MGVGGTRWSGKWGRDIFFPFSFPFLFFPSKPES